MRLLLLLGFRAMYDIHLSSGCDKQPNLTTLAAKIPMLAKPALLTHLQQPAPGFLVQLGINNLSVSDFAGQLC
ncbi:MAG: hypothetical protein ACPGWR_29300, partial [Ardenticatenaceae bacterium]